ncbi:MAG TPA: protein TolQ [Hellea balneolensis]|uniref:Protein TolQ n=1 Tax=Hellea balneolensis TaxID=287478 RepID=A0A7C3C4C5_9PROT|nr:protein TolQ [Hellea balneolensis]
MSLLNLSTDFISAVAVSALDAKDFSYTGLFLRADIVVKTIMIGLALASIWSWAIIIDKTISMRIMNKRANDFEETFWSGRTLDDLSEGLSGDTRDPMGRVFAAAMREWKESRASGLPHADMVGTRERIDRVMNLVVNRELTKAERGMTVLATVGSASVFVGLFGTVWGIMNAFRAIALSQNTNLAVVAPGIAEALFATALGLIAAIPAVVFYNKFTADLDRYAGRLDGYTDELSAILSRKISKG